MAKTRTREGAGAKNWLTFPSGNPIPITGWALILTGCGKHGGGVSSLVCQDFGYCGFCLEDITAFEIEQCLDIPVAIGNQVFQRLLEDPVGAGLLPNARTVEVLTAFCTQAPVQVVTARPEDAQ